MANQWFKFYGGEYLYDNKMKHLSACERSCWITLLCQASVSEIEGVIKYLSEKQLMYEAGVDPARDEWKETEGVLNKFADLKMIEIDNGLITVINWNKKQEKALTPYERVKKHRFKTDNEMKRMITDDNENDNDRIEENRKEKNRDIYTDAQFIEFWKLYPKKVGKTKALELWKKLSKEEKSAILQDIPDRMQDDKWVNGFVKDPERYIKNRQWEDDIIRPKGAKAGAMKF